jgi:hypothetical protein
MANNITKLKSDIRQAFATNLDAATLANIADAFVNTYTREWLEFTQQQGNADTPANRMQFAFNLWMKFAMNILESVTKDFVVKREISKVAIPTIGIEGINTELKQE